MIIATAGHVDHGKTTLLQAITGVNADRLPEEKSRGMTIDLGYAYWPQPDGRVLGFIDVPGHEKFLSNMLAGVGGIDHALLVVACDDGVMAQTREHLAILQLTGKPSLTVALTKADRVEAQRVEEVRGDVTAVLAEFNKALASDHTRLTVNGFSALGLVEMTRKRTRESLAHVLCEECPTCGGRGEVKTARTVCYEILRELLREARQFNAREFRVLGSVSVIDIFLDEESQGLAMLSDFIGKPISLKAEPSYTQEQYDIVLL